MSDQTDDRFILAVASSNAYKLDLFDTATGERIWRMDQVIPTPHEIAVDLNRRRIYMPSTYRTGAYGSTDRSHEVTVIDVDEKSVVGVIETYPYMGAHDVDYDAERDLIYISLETNAAGQNGVLVIDAESWEIVHNIPVTGINTHWMALSADGSRIYAAHKEDEFLSVIDTGKREVVDTVSIPGGSEEVAVSSDGGWVYVLSPEMGLPLTREDAEKRDKPLSQLLKIDASSHQVVGKTPLDDFNSALHVTADGKILVSQLMRGDQWATIEGGPSPSSVFLVDPDRMEVIASRELGIMPFTSRSTPDGKTAFVANLGSGVISVLDLPTLEVRDTWENTPPTTPGPGGSHGLALLPYEA